MIFGLQLDRDRVYATVVFYKPDGKQVIGMVQQDILDTAQHWLDEGRDIALATVIETWGSAPCPNGSQLVVDAQTNFIGSVSGGCVETAVIGEAQEVIKTGQPVVLEYGVTNEMAWEVGLACGGQIKVYVEPIIQA